MESHGIEIVPECGLVHVALFRNVKNASELRQRLISLDQSLSCALIDATLIVNVFHILLATMKAVHAEQKGKLKSRNVYSEIVFNLSPNTNITQSLRQFGISDTTENIIVVKVGGDIAEAEAFARKSVSGDLVPFVQLQEIQDIKRIQKVYQIGNQSSDPNTLVSLVSGATAVKERSATLLMENSNKLVDVTLATIATVVFNGNITL